MSSLCGTAPLSRVDLRWLHCFRPLSHAVFVQDCQYIVCWMQDLGLWAFLMFWSACGCIFVFSNCSHISFVIFQVYRVDECLLQWLPTQEDSDGFASPRKVFPCVPLKQRPLQQQSVIEVTFKHLENGLRALRKSLVCRLMRRQLLLVWSILLQQSSLYSTLESACYGINWHTLGMAFRFAIWLEVFLRRLKLSSQNLFP